MQSWSTRHALETAIAGPAAYEAAEAVVQEHYALIRDLYDEPTVTESQIQAILMGWAK